MAHKKSTQQIDNFKIIAIKVGSMTPYEEKRKNFSQWLDPQRNLKSHQIYQFRNDYQFPKNDFSKVVYISENDINLYEVKTAINNIPININAVVGGNGSGKSTLLELLYWANYNIGSRLNLLFDEDDKLRKPYNFLDFEILYSVDSNTIINVLLKEGKIYQQNYKQGNKTFLQDTTIQEVKNIEDLQRFFYTIVINYSHYALNSLEIGDWVNPLFHKNDGYQTPIVLNPMRTKGDIEINKEKHLLKRRLTANILEPINNGQIENSLRNIANDKIATTLELTHDTNSENTWHYQLEPIPSEVREKLFEAFNQYFKFQIDEQQSEEYFVQETLVYIYKKMLKMVVYKMFKKYAAPNSKEKIKYINAFIKRIYYSDSHIVFKVKGAILYLKYYKKLLPTLDFKRPFSIAIDELSKSIQDIRKSEPFMVNTFMLAKPPYFHTKILLKDGSPFDSLSSGEKQKIHSISSIVYHLINLNSVEQLKEDKTESSEKIIHYNYINIVLDEIELYYHPEWQRTYIADLLDYIGKISSENLKHIKGLNITFLTHSPYILSDIPNVFVLKLINGVPQTYKEGNDTFGANVHDLLANDFFMKKGFMGEWAKNQIKSVVESLTFEINIKRIESLKYKLENETDKAEKESINNEIKTLIKANSNYKRIEKSKCDSIISIVGEPVLYNSLLELYSKAYPNDKKDFIESQINKLKNLLNEKS
jgi:hypothetical protein